MWSLTTAAWYLLGGVGCLIGLIAIAVIVSYRPWRKLPGIATINLDQWQNKGWMLASGGYLLLLLGLYELWPAFWQWLTPGSFFFWWLVAGVPVITTLVVTKQKFASTLTTLWLVIALGAANWSAIPHLKDYHWGSGTAADTSAASKHDNGRAVGHLVGRNYAEVTSSEEWSDETITVPEYCHGTVFAKHNVWVLTPLGKTLPAGPDYVMNHWPKVGGGKFRFRAMETIGPDDHFRVKMVWEPD